MAVGAALLATAPRAQAVPDNGQLLIIATGAGAPAPIVVTTTTGFASDTTLNYAGWTIQQSSGTSYPVIGSPTNPKEDLLDLSVTTSGTAFGLKVVWSDTGFTYAGVIASGAGGTATDPMSFKTYYDPLNGLPSQVTGVDANNVLVNSMGPASGTFAVSANGTIPGNGGNPIGLTEEITIGPGAAQTTDSVDFSFGTVPDGGLTFALLGTTLVGLAGLRSRFGRNSA
jgi:hypothetical protein